MADITLSSGVGRHGFFQAIGHAISEAFARYQWARFQREVAILNDRLLKDIGLERRALMSARTAEEFSMRDGFIPRHYIG
jgi:uncharacterized protein YjiS (DUF1127 family)